MVVYLAFPPTSHGTESQSNELAIPVPRSTLDVIADWFSSEYNLRLLTQREPNERSLAETRLGTQYVGLIEEQNLNRALRYLRKKGVSTEQLASQISESYALERPEAEDVMELLSAVLGAVAAVQLNGDIVVMCD